MKLSSRLTLHGMLVLPLSPDFTLSELAQRFGQLFRTDGRH
jgi:hypothetical protein